MKYIIYKSPIGKITILSDDNHIVRVLLPGHPDEAEVIQHNSADSNNILKKAAQQLDEFFAGSRKQFDLPYKLDATDFQQKVYSSLCKIPYGNTASYKDIATKTGSPLAVRAVGTANRNNPLPLIIPCHRVIGSNNKPVGFTPDISLQFSLLELEKKYV